MAENKIGIRINKYPNRNFAIYPRNITQSTLNYDYSLGIDASALENNIPQRFLDSASFNKLDDGQYVGTYIFYEKHDIQDARFILTRSRMELGSLHNTLVYFLKPTILFASGEFLLSIQYNNIEKFQYNFLSGTFMASYFENDSTRKIEELRLMFETFLRSQGITNIVYDGSMKSYIESLPIYTNANLKNLRKMKVKVKKYNTVRNKHKKRELRHSRFLKNQLLKEFIHNAETTKNTASQEMYKSMANMVKNQINDIESQLAGIPEVNLIGGARKTRKLKGNG